MTLGEAAKATGKSKPTIARACKSGRLSAVRNPDGSYTIDESELYRVFPPRPDSVPAPMVAPSQARETDLLREMLERERSLNRDLIAERDRLLAMLERGPLQLPDQRPWWRRIFRS